MIPSARPDPAQQPLSAPGRPHPAIVVDCLTKRYSNGITACCEIDLEVDGGEIVGILGPNGAGKTTLVRQITGELIPTSGRVIVSAVDVWKTPLAAKRLMGVVPQDAQPYGYLRPLEHLELFGRLHGLTRNEARIRSHELSSAFDLDRYARLSISQLSGGNKRKLLVANALVASPKVLILDEPTTGLDPASRREVWTALRRLRGGGSTILLTTHYMEEAEALCDSVAIMLEGRIVATGSVEHLRRQIHHHYRAVFREGESGEPTTLLCETYEEALRRLEELHVTEYEIGKTKLEDIYLELMGR